MLNITDYRRIVLSVGQALRNAVIFLVGSKLSATSDEPTRSRHLPTVYSTSLLSLGRLGAVPLVVCPQHQAGLLEPHLGLKPTLLILTCSIRASFHAALPRRASMVQAYSRLMMMLPGVSGPSAHVANNRPATTRYGQLCSSSEHTSAISHCSLLDEIAAAFPAEQSLAITRIQPPWRPDPCGVDPMVASCRP